MEPRPHGPKKTQPIRELQWLAHYFLEHGREDLAQRIFLELKDLRQRAQDSLNTADASDILEFPNQDDEQTGG